MMTMRCFGQAGALVLLLLAQPAAAQLEAIDGDLPPLFRERLAFDMADTDNDGLVSEAEFARDAIVAFTSLDRDGKGHLTPEDLGDHDPALFARVDADGDGVLSFDEVMTFKMDAFAAADADGDGYLTFDEMMESAVRELAELRP
jgi:Ca2+-binding EF-hand superfamily protein